MIRGYISSLKQMRQSGLHLTEQFLVVLLRSVFGHVRLPLRTRLHLLHKLLFNNQLRDSRDLEPTKSTKKTRVIYQWRIYIIDF